MYRLAWQTSRSADGLRGGGERLGREDIHDLVEIVRVRKRWVDDTFL